MKAFILMLGIAALALLLPNSGINSFTDYSPTGWTASTGMSYMPGLAIQRVKIPNGWRFKCLDVAGICYEINGPWLTINDFTGDASEGASDPIDITKN